MQSAVQGCIQHNWSFFKVLLVVVYIIPLLIFLYIQCLKICVLKTKISWFGIIKCFSHSFPRYLTLFRSVIVTFKKNHLYVKLVETTTLPPRKWRIWTVISRCLLKTVLLYYMLASERKKSGDLGILILFLSCQMYCKI